MRIGAVLIVVILGMLGLVASLVGNSAAPISEVPTESVRVSSVKARKIPPPPPRVPPPVSDTAPGTSSVRSQYLRTACRRALPHLPAA